MIVVRELMFLGNTPTLSEAISINKLFSDIFLQELLDSIRDRHYQIDDLFCSGNGLDLQKLDNEIIEYIVGDFTERNLPILCNNNSFIIWKEQLDLLVNISFSS